MLRILALALLLFLPTSALIGYATSPATVVLTDPAPMRAEAVRVCPSADLLRDTEVAVGEWNRAIAFFSVRFGWLELLGIRFEVAETGCDVYVVLGKTPERTNGMTLPAKDDNNRTVFVVAVSDTLPPDRRGGVITHEMIHILGLLDGVSPNAPFRPAVDSSGLGRVTSHDIFALYSKYVRGADGMMVEVPPHIPYMTADMPLPDIASAAISVLTALTLDRMFRRRRKA